MKKSNKVQKAWEKYMNLNKKVPMGSPLLGLLMHLDNKRSKSKELR